MSHGLHSELTIDNDININSIPNINNNTLINKEDSFFRNRKDPKKMTMDELDEFLKKNNIHDSSNLVKKINNKDSFYSNNYSQFNESSKINSNTNANSNNSNIDVKKDQKKSSEIKSQKQNSDSKSTNALNNFDESSTFTKKVKEKELKHHSRESDSEKNSKPFIKDNFFSEENFKIVKSSEKILEFNETDQLKKIDKSFASPFRDNIFNFSGFSNQNENTFLNDHNNKLNITYGDNFISSPQSGGNFNLIFYSCVKCDESTSRQEYYISCRE